jgi:hypothetical protein
MKFFFLFCALIVTASIGAQTNYALSFDGNNQYVSIGAPLSNNTSYTKEAWVNVPITSGARNIISSAAAPFWINGGSLQAGHGGSYSNVTDATAFPLDKWTHVAVTYDAATTTMKLYRDGILVNTATGVASNYTSEATYIASHSAGSSVIQGSVDEVRIWNVARTQAQIKQNLYNPPANNASGLVAYYKFNDGSGTTLTNSTGGTNGTLLNSPTWVASPVVFAGNGLNFDGTDDFVTIPPNSSLDITTAITLEAWVYATKNSGIQNVISKSSSSPNNGYIFPRTDNGWTNTIIYFHIAGGWRTLSAVYPSLNAWHHLAATYDGATIRLYIDGIQAASQAQSGSITTNGNAVVLGNQTGTSEFFGGTMDEVRIWNVARTQAQIQSSMNIQLDPTTQTGLVSYYSFNHGIPSSTNTGMTSLVDLKSENNGTLTNFALTGATSNYTTQNAVLPLQWLSFTVQQQNEKVALNWSTASEQNTKDFIIQHSINGVEWNSLGTVPAAGNSNTVTRYNYVHLSPPSVTNYYRILQIDIDGRSSYSEIRTVKLFTGDVSFAILKNPVDNGLIQIRLKRAAKISLISSEGKLLWQKQLPEGTFPISINNYSKGIYFLKSNGQSEKLIVR